MTNIIDLTSRRAPAWGAQVIIYPWPFNEAKAELTGFWGSDSKEVSERCSMYAGALRRLADEMDETAALTKGDQHE